MVAEHLHAGLGVGVVSRFETQLSDAQLGEELPQDAHEVAQGEAVISHNALDLVELSQVRGIQGLVPEHTIDGEVLGWCEGLLLRQAVEGAGTG